MTERRVPLPPEPPGADAPARARRRRRDVLATLAAGPVVLLLTAPQLARGAGILAVRLWPAKDYTRVTIESDRPLDAKHNLIDAPHRLTVDIDGLELDSALRELVGQVRPDDPYIQGVRVGQFKPRVVRLVLDLKQPVRPEQFALQPVAPYQHRLIFDLYPAQELDPLLTLVREREEASQRAARALQDALGELIARNDPPLGGPAAPAGPAAAASRAGPGPVADPASAVAAASMPSAVLPPGQRAAASSATPGAPTGLPAPSLSPSLPPSPAPVPMSPAPPPPVAPLTAAERQRIDRLFIVALDPGHGGEDPGAIGPTGLREKDVVLAIALELRERLNAVPGMRVMLTRDSDHFVPLVERVRKAQRVQADLFVSLHADAFLRREARGASVFALSTRGATSATARWMADRENASDRIGGVNVGRVRDPQLLQAMLDMSTTAQIKDSLVLGREVLGRLSKVGNLHKPQVEQAGFAVLKAPDIPSILVETAFISNPEEEKLLRSAVYRTQLVGAISAGIRRYFAKNPPLARQRQLG